MRQFIFTKIASFLFLSLFAATACYSAEFRYRLNEDTGTLDWGNGEVKPNLILQLMEGLVSLGPNGEPLPALAKSWKKTKTGYEFELRGNAKWSDGKPVCAQHFIDAWTRVLSPSFASPYAHYLFDVKNAVEFNSSKIKDASKLGLKAFGCRKLVVTLKSNIGYFPQLTSHWVLFPVRLDLIQKYGSAWTQPQNLKVTGPYVLTEWRRDERFTLKKNPFYYSKIAGTETLKALVIKDDTTALSLFDQGSLDWISDIPFLEKQNVSKRPEYLLFPTLVQYHLGFRFKPDEPLNKNARCALLQSLDKKQIPKILQGGEIPAWKLDPDAFFTKGLHVKENHEFDPTMAKKMWGSKIKNITLSYYTKDIHNPLMEWIQQEWKKNLGVEVRLEKSESKSYWSRLSKDPPEIFLSGITAAYPHPNSFLSEFLSTSAGNWGHFSSQKYDALVYQAANEAVGHKLIHTINAAEDVLIRENCAIIPLYVRTTASLVSKHWDGFHMNPMAYVYLKDVHNTLP